MSELASISVFASPTPEIEAGFSTKEVGSDHFLLYQIGLLTHQLPPCRFGRARLGVVETLSILLLNETIIKRVEATQWSYGGVVANRGTNSVCIYL